MIVGVSEEVVQHHLSQHTCKTDEFDVLRCPCGRSHAVMCSACQTVLVLMCGSDPCEHAIDVMP